MEEAVAVEKEESAEEDMEDGVGGGEEEAGLHAIHGGNTKSTRVLRVTCLTAVRRFTQWAVKVMYVPCPCLLDYVSVVRCILAPTLCARDTFTCR